MKRIVLIIICIILSISCLSQRITNSELPALHNALISVSAKKIKTGKDLYSLNSKMPLCPASLLKLITTSMVYMNDYQTHILHTKIYKSGYIKNGILYGDIIIYSSGDASLDSKYFPDKKFTSQFLDIIKSQGINEIRGRIKIKRLYVNDDCSNEMAVVPATWQWEDVSNYYGASVFDFNYKDNSYDIYFRSENEGELTDIVDINPNLPEIKFINEVISSNSNRDNAYIYGGPYSKKLIIRGSIPKNRRRFKISGSMPNPAKFFIYNICNKLKNLRIYVRGEEYDVSTKSLIGVYKSPSLGEIVNKTNKFSINLFSEFLAGYINSFSKLGNYEKTVNNKLSALGIDTLGIHIVDGCGLSRYNHIPADVFTSLLINMSKYNAGFTQSLSYMGQTSPYRFEREWNVYAKTGSMQGVRALSGYMQSRSKENIAFTIIVNNYTCPIKDVYTAMYKVLEHIYKSN